MIAGNGNFPVLFAQQARSKGTKVVCVGIEGETKDEIRALVDKFYSVRLGQLGSLLKIFKEEQISKAVMAGGVQKTRLFRELIWIDIEAIKLFMSLKDKRDASILGAVAERLKKEGVQLIDSTTYLTDYLAKPGILTMKTPTQAQLEDIDFGKKIARELSRLDIGMTVVIKDKVVLAAETIEGTDQAILRGGEYGHGDVVVVKVARPAQDLRYDLPVVGPLTIDTLAKASAACLAIEAHKTLIIDLERFIERADKANISVVVFE